MNILDIAVVLNLAATSTSPALVEEVFQQREPNGEYLFHVAADAGAVVTAPDKRSTLGKLFGGKQNHAQQVLGANYMVAHEVNVAFGEIGRDIAQSYIDEGHALLEPYGYHTLTEQYDLADDAIGEILIKFKTDSLHMQIDAGDDYTSFVTLQTNYDQSTDMTFNYWRVTDDRTLHIFSICKDPDYPMRDVFEYWQSMVDKYSDMPVQVFSGASKF